MFTSGATPLFNITAGTAPITLDELSCVGIELLLIDCPHLPLGNHYCNHSQDVGVRCLATSPGQGVWLYMFCKLKKITYKCAIINFLIKLPQALVACWIASGIFPFWHKFHRIVQCNNFPP